MTCCYRIPFTGVIQWPHLDFGAIGVTKQFIGIDLVAVAPEGLSVSIGYNQRDLAARTEPYDVDPDTLDGQIIPFPLSAPSFDLKIEFAAEQKWEWNAAVLYIQDRRPTS